MAVITELSSARRAATHPLPHAQTAQTIASRIAVIDVKRGIAMLIMMIDHVRETFFLHMQVGDPMVIERTDPALFFTRLAAHFCAPVFVFLTGLSAWLYAHPAHGARDATGFLFKRGLLLVALELTLVNFAWTGTAPPSVLYLQVIWVIGLAMIALAALHRLPPKAVLLLGAAIVGGHNLLDAFVLGQVAQGHLSLEPGSAAHVVWTVLEQRGFLIADGPLKVKISYPLLPWIGVILLGYAAGPLYGAAMSAARRRALLLKLGIGAFGALAVLRGLNLYGERAPWQPGADLLHSAMSFLNFTKYPPSLAFVLFTLGLGLLGLAWLEGRDNRITRACATFGGAPMFYYLLHLYVLLVLQRLASAWLGDGGRYDVDSIASVWLIAAALIPLLYLPCRWFGRYKRTNGKTWVRYL